MNNYIKKILRLFLSGFLFLILVACSNNNEERLNYFNQQVNKNIKDKNLVIAHVKDLTNFEWDRVCFRRYESYGMPYIPLISNGKDEMVLNFYIEKKKIESFELSTEKFYLSETYYIPLDENHNPIYEKYIPLLGICSDYNEKLTLKKQGKKVEILKENDKNHSMYQEYFKNLSIKNRRKNEQLYR